MKVQWEDGYHVDIPFGSYLEGMQGRERCPVEVLISPEEILDSGISINHLYAYLRSLTNYAKL